MAIIYRFFSFMEKFVKEKNLYVRVWCLEKPQTLEREEDATFYATNLELLNNIMKIYFVY